MFFIHFSLFVYVINLCYVSILVWLISDIQRSGSWKKVSWSTPFSPREPLLKRSFKYKCWIQYLYERKLKLFLLCLMVFRFLYFAVFLKTVCYSKSSKVRFKRLCSHCHPGFCKLFFLSEPQFPMGRIGIINNGYHTPKCFGAQIAWAL